MPSTSLEGVRTNAARGFWPMLSSSTVSATGAVLVDGWVDRFLPWILRSLALTQRVCQDLVGVSSISKSLVGNQVLIEVAINFHFPAVLSTRTRSPVLSLVITVDPAPVAGFERARTPAPRMVAWSVSPTTYLPNTQAREPAGAST